MHIKYKDSDKIHSKIMERICIMQTGTKQKKINVAVLMFDTGNMR